MAEDRQPAETASSSRSRSRRRILTRPLFLYAYLNPGVSFVQGMSYIAAVFIYVFAQAPPAPRSESPPAESAADLLLEAEASTFFALSALLSQLRDLFVPALDGLSPGGGAAGAPTTVAGIGSASNRFRALLLAIDATAANALERKGIDLRGFVVRWLTTLFANEVSVVFTVHAAEQRGLLRLIFRACAVPAAGRSAGLGVSPPRFSDSLISH